MKHANEYALCPKVATEEMIHAAGCGVDYPSVYMGGPRDQSKRTGRRAAEAAISAAPAYEPSDEDVERVKAALIEACRNPVMVKCTRCDGRGYHHGFGEHGHDPDWCEECGGNQYIEDESHHARAAIRAFIGGME